MMKKLREGLLQDQENKAGWLHCLKVYKNLLKGGA
jgi:hypothetical protein